MVTQRFCHASNSSCNCVLKNALGVSYMDFEHLHSSALNDKSIHSGEKQRHNDMCAPAKPSHCDAVLPSRVCHKVLPQLLVCLIRKNACFNCVSGSALTRAVLRKSPAPRGCCSAALPQAHRTHACSPATGHNQPCLHHNPKTPTLCKPRDKLQTHTITTEKPRLGLQLHAPTDSVTSRCYWWQVTLCLTSKRA